MLCFFVFVFIATIRPERPLEKKALFDFGEYVGSCLPKYIQKVQLTHSNELEILIHPDGIIPVITFLKDHHNAQYLNIVDIAGVDVPTKPYRFEVIMVLISYGFFCLGFIVSGDHFELFKSYFLSCIKSQSCH